MSEPTTDKVAVTTAADGSATAYSKYFSGQIIAVRYEKGDFADTVDFTITTETGGVGVWTESNVTASDTTFPTMLVQDQVNVDTALRDFIYSFADRVKIILASGGNAKSGTFYIYHN